MSHVLHESTMVLVLLSSELAKQFNLSLPLPQGQHNSLRFNWWITGGQQATLHHRKNAYLPRQTSWWSGARSISSRRANDAASAWSPHTRTRIVGSRHLRPQAGCIAERSCNFIKRLSCLQADSCPNVAITPEEKLTARSSAVLLKVHSSHERYRRISSWALDGWIFVEACKKLAQRQLKYNMVSRICLLQRQVFVCDGFEFRRHACQLTASSASSHLQSKALTALS